MKNRILSALVFLILPFAAFANKLNVVSTSPDFGDIAKQIGGDRVSVVSLYKGTQDPHAIEPRPSMVMSVRNADMLIVIGMDLDLWVSGIIDVAKNSKVLKGAPGYLDASAGIKKEEVPIGKVDFGMGDVHIYGNPHFQTDPDNGKIVAESIFKKLCELDPAGADYYKKNYEDFIQRLDAGIKKWDEMLKPYAGTKIITYHPSWGYFAGRFNFNIIGTIEPKPSIPPSGSYIAALVEKMKSEKVRLILMEPYFDVNIAKRIAEETGVKVVICPQSVGGVKGADDYISLFDVNVRNLVNALK